MIGQAVVRILLVVTLIVTAHAIKPFSFKNITRHLLYSTRSFDFILPDSARISFNHANQLAMTFSNSLFESGQVDRSLDLPEQSAANMTEVAIESRSLAESSSKSVKPRVKPAKPISRQQILARRMNSGGSNYPVQPNGNAVSIEETLTADEVVLTAPFESASTDSVETTVLTMPRRLYNAAMPVKLPEIKSKLTCSLIMVKPMRVERIQFLILPLQIERMNRPSQPIKSNCDKREANQIKLITSVDIEKILSPEWSRAERSFVSILEIETKSADSVIDAGSVIEAEDRIEEVAQPVIRTGPAYSESCSFEP